MRGSGWNIFFMTLLALGLFMSAASANDPPYSINNSDDETTGAAPGSLSASWQPFIARRQARAVWRRFSPERRGLLSPDSPWQAGGGRGGYILPVAGETSTPQGWGLWMQGEPMRQRNVSAALRGKGYTLSQTVGLDRQLTEQLTAGLTIAYNYTHARTLYNNGREHTHGLVVGPYLSMQFMPWLSVDVQGGYVWQRQKLRRVDAAGLHEGRRSSHGFHFATAVNAWKWVGEGVMLSGRLGMIASADYWKAYTEQGPGFLTPVNAQTQKLLQGVMEGSLAAWLDPVMPYARLAYTHDLYRRNVAASSDRDDFTLSGGVQWFGSGEAEGLSLDVGGNVIVGRRYQRHWGLNASLKWSW